MNRHRRVLLTILILVVLLVPAYLSRRAAPDSANRSPLSPAARAIGPDGVLRTGTPVRGGTLMASARSEPKSFNRMATNNQATEIYTVLTQAKLVRINRVTSVLEPWVAEKWTASPDKTTYTFSLREGMKWSDGAPFSAADVIFSFDAAYQPGSIIRSSLTIGGKPLIVSAPDARTVVVQFPGPSGPGIRLLDNMPLYPKHKLEAAVRGGTFPSAWSASAQPSELAGLGPFMLTRYEPGQRLIYDRNPHYFRKDERGEQLPYLDRLVVEMVPQQDAEIVRLRAGEVDVMQDPLRAEDISTFRTLAEQGRVQVHDVGVATEGNHFFFNLRPEKWAKDSRAAWMPKKEFRQAISHAVDREAFANTVFLGEAVPIHGPITPANREWFWPDIPRYQPSVEKARALLDGLGLRNRDADEWLEDDKGNEARFNVEIFGNASWIERTAQVLRDDLKRVGIDMNVVSLAPNLVIEHVTKGQFDAALVAFQFSDLDPALSLDYWLSSGSTHLWNPAQKTPATPWEAEIDGLMLKVAATSNLEERKRLFREVQRIFSENLPMLYFAAQRVYIAVSPRVTSMAPSVLRPQVLWNAEILALAPARPTS